MSQNKDEKTLSSFINATQVLNGEVLDTVTLQLLVIDDAFNVYRTQTSEDIQSSLVEYFLLPVATRIIQGPEEGVTFETYDPNLSLDPLVVWQKPASSVDNYVNIADQISGNFDELPVFTDDVASIDRVGSLAVLVAIGDETMLIFQQFVQRSVLKNSMRIKVAFGGASFRKIEEKAVFQLSRDNHVVAYGDELLILDRKPFEAIFRYQDQKRDIANDKLNKIQEKYSGIILLPEDKTLSDLIGGDSPTINKLLVLDLADLANIDDTAYDVNEDYEVGLEIDDNTGKMCIASKKDAKAFVAIVNEDFVSSATGRKYVTQSKKKVKVTQP